MNDYDERESLINQLEYFKDAINILWDMHIEGLSSEAIEGEVAEMFEDLQPTPNRKAELTIRLRHTEDGRRIRFKLFAEVDPEDEE